uniref:hypothetical protein n=1 Tax=Burkholderia arboris TaxID=488730 RepID=UPI003BEEC3CE
MKISELFGASITAAIVAFILIGLLSYKDFGLTSIYFGGIAFAISFASAMILSYPMFLIKSLIPAGLILPLLAIIGAGVAVFIMAILAKSSWADLISVDKMVLLYASIGIACAVSAFGYTERALIVKALRKFLG